MIADCAKCDDSEVVLLGVDHLSVCCPLKCGIVTKNLLVLITHSGKFALTQAIKTLLEAFGNRGCDGQWTERPV